MPLIERFGRIVEPFDKRVLSNSLEITGLTRIRDALLPMLLSGEIRVHEAEQELEAVL
jgi:type I restriction enzyme S subunit